MGEAENKLKKEIIKYLTLRGHTVWRCNQGRFQGKYYMGKTGVPDIIGFTREGFFIGVEAKAAGDQNEEQKNFGNLVEQTQRGIYLIARNLEDVIKSLDNITHHVI